jgi:hypothetical protein
MSVLNINSPIQRSRSAADHRAIDVTARLLVAGIWLERQLGNAPKVLMMRRRPVIALVADPSHTDADDAEKEGEGRDEYLQERRARTNLGHGNGNSSRPSVAHLWEGTDLYRVGMPNPSLDLQPDSPVFASRSLASLNATPQTQTQAPTLATLRRLTVRATP